MPWVNRDSSARPRPIVAQERRRSVSQPIPSRDVDTFIFEVALLIGHICDQFFVNTAPDIGQVDRVHGDRLFFQFDDFRSGTAAFSPSQGHR
jgi:hypothetical protein